MSADHENTNQDVLEEYVIERSEADAISSTRWSNANPNSPIVKSFLGKPYLIEDEWLIDVTYFGEVHEGLVYDEKVQGDFLSVNGADLVEFLDERYNGPSEEFTAYLWECKELPFQLFPRGLIVRSKHEPDLPAKIRAFNREKHHYLSWEPHSSQRLYEVYHVDSEGKKAKKLPPGHLAAVEIYIDPKDFSLQSLKHRQLLSTSDFLVSYNGLRVQALEAEKIELADENAQLRGVITGSVTGLFAKASVKIASALRQKKSALKKYQVFMTVPSLVSEVYVEPRLKKQYHIDLKYNTSKTKWSGLIDEDTAKELFVADKLQWTNPQQTLTYNVIFPIRAEYSHAKSKQTLRFMFRVSETNLRTGMVFELM